MDRLVATPSDRFRYWEAWVRDEWVKAEALRLPKGSKVLDAGAGASKYRPFFSHCSYQTQDFCQYQGKLVKYVEPIDFVCEITRVPLPDASLDAILCTEVLEHVTDPVAVVREFARLIKPGGRVLLTAPFGSGLHMEPYHYHTGFTHYWYQHWLPAVGFAIDSITPQGGPGRAVACSLDRFYTLWRAHGESLSGTRRALARMGRLLLKLPTFYLVPWILPKLDRGFNQLANPTGLMVAGTRVAPQAHSISVAQPA